MADNDTVALIDSINGMPMTDTQADNFDAMQPEWQKNAVIYEVNMRQGTKEGTFKAFNEQRLEKLDELGVDILWFMPVFPVSATKRKGSMGSYYAVGNFKEVNPEFGTMEDFEAIIARAHELGMKVILDWVPNHTGWDNEWIKTNPEWYTMENDTIIHPKETDWTDVADLNYDNPDMREAMISSMEYWVRDKGVDGFRMDVAGKVPDDFWTTVRTRLNAIKPVFMLSEWGDNANHFEVCFNANYAWDLHHTMGAIAKEGKPVSTLNEYLLRDRTQFPAHGYHMSFITNHDENSWNDFPNVLGDNADVFAVLTYTLQGMPLIYTGQEGGGLGKKILFFEKDEITYDDMTQFEFYKTLNELHHNNKALYNGLYGGRATIIPVSDPDHTYAYYREKDGHKVLTVLNFSDDAVDVQLSGDGFAGDYDDVFGGQSMTVAANATMNLPAHSYKVLEMRQ